MPERALTSRRTSQSISGCLRLKRSAAIRIFCAEELSCVGWQWPIAQINHTATHHKGTVRGMHYQVAPHAEMKLVQCLKGEVWDVAVDLRRSSSTFGQWEGVRLSAENHRQLWVP
ncbi:MAG: dTDP-4-keto-6-deoxy-D-glucose epimerase, partial [Planctomycetes bacterium]|nr:dTDP-4-keto-6-deoxy-D-glucose epimerase [Planctomycetota bacterium]